MFSQSGQSTAVRGTVGNVATDHPWMANTALWDSWFLSSIVDGTGLGSSAWLDDPRSPRAQFRDFAEGKRTLRNKRLIFNPYQTPDKAVSALFNGENFKTSAINQLPAYLLVDGCFNVISTSEKAWAALLTSVRDQNLISANGGTKSFNHPFGTLGYAVSNASSGTEGDWTGLRDLSNSEIEKLATAIVTEVKSRGPFLSMAPVPGARRSSSGFLSMSIPWTVRRPRTDVLPWRSRC